MIARAFCLALVVSGCFADSVSGRLVATTPSRGSWELVPSRCTVTGPDRPPTEVILGSPAEPLRYVSIQRYVTTVEGTGDGTPAVPSILGGTPYALTVHDLATGPPIVLTSADCHTLSLTTRPAFSSRYNAGPVVYHYSGTLELDCDYAEQPHALVGRFEFTCPYY